MSRRADPRILSRRSFVWAGIAALGTWGSLRWLFTRRLDGGAQWPVRRALEVNEGFWGDLFSRKHKVPEYTADKLTPERENGDEGLGDDFDPTTWKLKVDGLSNQDGPIELTLAELQAMPHTEMITELFCIEGWSIVQKWKGVRFVDFARKYPPMTLSGDPPDLDGDLEDVVRYVSLKTPDEGYYVGLDMPSALHEQTLLCWEMNDKPLAMEHGAPLRLVVPTKYGIKNIKRIGSLTYTDQRPRDFWAEQGYDWFAGL